LAFFDFDKQIVPRDIRAMSNVYLKRFNFWIDVMKAESRLIFAVSARFATTAFHFN